MHVNHYRPNVKKAENFAHLQMSAPRTGSRCYGNSCRWTVQSPQQQQQQQQHVSLRAAVLPQRRRPICFWHRGTTARRRRRIYDLTETSDFGGAGRADPNGLFTPPDPTRRNCIVASCRRRRCALASTPPGTPGTHPPNILVGGVNGNIPPILLRTFGYSRPILVALRSLSLKPFSFGYKTPPIRFSPLPHPTTFGGSSPQP